MTAKDIDSMLQGPLLRHQNAIARTFHKTLGWFALEPFEWTLSAFLSNKRFVGSKKILASVAAALAEVLKIAGEKRLVHGDLHLKNIGVFRASENNTVFTVKLCDYSHSYTSKEAALAGKDLKRLYGNADICGLGNVGDKVRLLNCILLFLSRVDNTKAITGFAGRFCEESNLMQDCASHADTLEHAGLRDSLQAIASLTPAWDTFSKQEPAPDSLRTPLEAFLRKVAEIRLRVYRTSSAWTNSRVPKPLTLQRWTPSACSTSKNEPRQPHPDIALAPRPRLPQPQRLVQDNEEEQAEAARHGDEVARKEVARGEPFSRSAYTPPEILASNAPFSARRTPSHSGLDFDDDESSRPPRPPPADLRDPRYAENYTDPRF